MQHDEPHSAPLYVAIGASAGGVGALRRFFAGVNKPGRSAYLVMQHLDPADRALALDVLTHATPLPVREVEEGLSVEPGVVYLCPPRSLVALRQGAFRVKKLTDAKQRLEVIDHLFSSLAAAGGPRTVGVVLSGEFHDGAAGLKEIGEAGGLTFAQNPEEAEHPAMPAQAISRGVVDHVMSAEEMPAAIASNEKFREGARAGEAPTLAASISAELGPICAELKRATGHDFRHYKASTLVRRIQRRLQVRQCESVARYLAELRERPEEVQALFRDLLIHVTCFFRDPEAFEAFRLEALRPAVEQAPRGRKFRVWVAGCSTGEEAYSLAILLREELARLPHPPEAQVIATDVDEAALATARRGSYPVTIAEHVSEERLERFFTKKGGRYQVRKDLRELCLFSLHNLITDPPFSQLDVVSCRNVMIYFGAQLQKKLIPVFHYALRPGGLLFLGSSETLSAHRELFHTVSPRHRIGQRRAHAARVLPGGVATRINTAPLSREGGGSATGAWPELAERLVVEEFSPRYVVVKEDGELALTSSGISRYVDVPEGLFHANLLKLVKAPLRASLRATFAEAKRRGARVDHDSSTVKGAGGAFRVGLSVRPLAGGPEESSLYLVVFRELGPLSEAGAPPRAPEGDRPPWHLVDQLEGELGTLRADLDKTVQDLEASNEELKSSNEELMSMNEELQSSNEELETSKEDVQAANDALLRANSDLENLLTSTRIATLFLDENLCIRSFTPAISVIYGLLPSDVGRPITDFSSRALQMPPYPAAQELKAEEVHEAEVPLANGRVFLRRLTPYRTHDRKREGLVAAFIDVTELRRSEERLQLAMESARLGWWRLDLRTQQITVAPQVDAIFGARMNGDVNQIIDHAMHPDDRADVHRVLDAAIASGRPYVHEYRIVRPGGEVRWVQSRGSLQAAADGTRLAMSGVLLDVTDQKTSENELDYQLRLNQVITNNAASSLFMMDERGHPTFMNPAAERLTGYKLADIKDRPLHYAIHYKKPDGAPYPMEECPIDNAQAALTAVRDGRETFVDMEGRLYPVSFSVSPLEREGRMVGSVLEFRDITEEERTRRTLRETVQTLETLSKIGQEISGELNLEKLVQSITDAGTQLARAAFGAFFYNLVDAKGESYTLYSISGVPRSEFEKFPMPRKTEIFAPTFDGAGIVRSDDITKDPRYGRNHPRHGMPEGHLPVRSYLAAPVISKSGVVLGGLFFGHPEPGVFTAKEEELVRGVASYAAVAIDNAQLFKQAQDAVKTRDEFLSIASHELKTPLTSLKLQMQTLARRISKNDPAAVNPENLHMMSQVATRQTTRLANLIEDMLDVARIGTGKMHFDFREVNLAQLLQEAYAGFGPQARDAGVEISVSAPEQVCINADAFRLEQVITNLLSNSLKYGNQRPVAVSLRTEGDHALLEVKDQGIGIPAEHQKRIFERFERAVSARGVSGLGIGLFVSREIVQAHGGEIRLTSEAGRGSVFTVVLPLAAAVSKQ